MNKSADHKSEHLGASSAIPNNPVATDHCPAPGHTMSHHLKGLQHGKNLRLPAPGDETHELRHLILASDGRVLRGISQ